MVKPKAPHQLSQKNRLTQYLIDPIDSSCCVDYGYHLTTANQHFREIGLYIRWFIHGPNTAWPPDPASVRAAYPVSVSIDFHLAPDRPAPPTSPWPASPSAASTSPSSLLTPRLQPRPRGTYMLYVVPMLLELAELNRVAVQGSLCCPIPIIYCKCRYYRYRTPLRYRIYYGQPCYLSSRRLH